MRKYYGIRKTEWSWNDSDEKIRDWGTAQVFVFDSKKERDAWCDSSHYNMPITAKRAKFIGFEEINMD